MFCEWMGDSAGWAVSGFEQRESWSCEGCDVRLVAKHPWHVGRSWLVMELEKNHDVISWIDNGLYLILGYKLKPPRTTGGGNVKTSNASS